MFADTVQAIGITAVQPSAPVNPLTGDGWLKTPSNILYVYNGFTWAQVAGTGTSNPVVSGNAHDDKLDLTLQDGTVITVNTLPIVDGGRY